MSAYHKDPEFNFEFDGDDVCELITIVLLAILIAVTVL
jgi:hypothetical protein